MRGSDVTSPFISPHRTAPPLHRIKVCLGCRLPGLRCTVEGLPRRTNERAAVDSLLGEMLLRARQGHTDGCLGSTTEADALSPIRRRVRAMVRGEDGVFTAWLRAVNERMMRGQLQACQAILEAIERAEEGEEEGGQEGEEAAAAAAAAGVDVQAYMTAWGLDPVLERRDEQEGAGGGGGGGGGGGCCM
jgi:hypothetical protein